jgi:hypothetical protein
MSGNRTLAGASVDQAARPIAIAMAATIGVTVPLHWIFDVVPAARTPAYAGIQRRKATKTVDRLATNQTPLAHSASLFTHTTLTSTIADAVHTTSWATTVKLQPACNTPARGCC